MKQVNIYIVSACRAKQCKEADIEQVRCTLQDLHWCPAFVKFVEQAGLSLVSGFWLFRKGGTYVCASEQRSLAHKPDYGLWHVLAVITVP